MEETDKLVAGGPAKAPAVQEEEMCCCCICRCSEPETKNLACCGCLPIKCGVLIIGFFILVLTVLLVLELFACLLSDEIVWWYSAVAFCLIIPVFIGASFVVNFYVKDTDGSRGKMWVACQFVIISFTLLAIWNFIYFYYFYHYNSVYTGTASTGRVKRSKKAFIVWGFLVALVIDSLFAYFLCVCYNYSDARAPPDAPKEEGVKAPEMPKIGGCCSCCGDDKPEEMEAKKEEEKK
jgi:hypothetical protein